MISHAATTTAHRFAVEVVRGFSLRRQLNPLPKQGELKMATKDELFASRFFKGDGFKRPLDVEIWAGVVEKLKNAEGVTKEKLVLFFVGEKQQLVCNATNFDTIVELTGETDTDMWIGHKICLYPATTQLGTKKVPCIRVRAVAIPVKKAPASARKKTATPSDDIEIDDAPSISDEELSQMAKESAERSDDDDF